MLSVLVGLVLTGCGTAHESGLHPAESSSHRPDPTRVAAPARTSSAPTPTHSAPTRTHSAPTRTHSAPTSAPEPTATASVIRRVSAAELGASWHPGCPVGPAGLRAVTVPYLGFDGQRHQGTLVVAARVAGDVHAVFVRLYAERFPIRRMVPVSAFGGDDERSMEADNTSAFNCRPITGGSGWSKHAYGTAIDVNTLENPYVRSEPESGARGTVSGNTVQPTTARRYVQRAQHVRGMIHAGDPIVTVFAGYGWSWGGTWTDPTDYQHFELGN